MLFSIRSTNQGLFAKRALDVCSDLPLQGVGSVWSVELISSIDGLFSTGSRTEASDGAKTNVPAISYKTIGGSGLNMHKYRSLVAAAASPPLLAQPQYPRCAPEDLTSQVFDGSHKFQGARPDRRPITADAVQSSGKFREPGRQWDQVLLLMRPG